MLNRELQDQLRTLLPGHTKTQPYNIRRMALAAGLSSAATFALLVYIGDIHKLPLATTLMRLQHMLAHCTGATAMEVRMHAGKREGQIYPAFSMAHQLDTIQYTLDLMEAGHCVRPARPFRYRAEWPPVKK